MLELLAKEFRLAARALRHRPGLTLAALATLGLGIGANAAVFSVLNSVLLQPLPYRDSERLLTLWPEQFFSNREIQYLRDNLKSVEQVASLSPGWLMALTGVNEPTEVSAGRVSGNLFSMLGVRPQLGRIFDAESERPGNDRVVVLSDDLWRTQFGGDAAIVGRSITLNQQSYEVIGVMPRDFDVLTRDSDLWYPLTMDPRAQWWNGQVTLAFGRLAVGSTSERADQEFRALASRMGQEFAHPDAYATSASVQVLKDYVVGPVRGMMLVLFAAVCFILLIATANVANLLLVRATERRTEFAVRRALGASGGALLRQLTAESIVLASAGGAVGVLLAFLGVQAIRRWMPDRTPRLQEISIDLRVIAFCALVTIVIGILIGIAPTWFASTRKLATSLRAGRTTTGAAGRVRALLVVAEVALAVVLVCGASLMLRTLARLHSIDPGFASSRVLSLRLQPSQASNDAEVRAYWRALLPQLAALPGVEAVGTVLHLPMSGRKWSANVEVEGVTLPPGVATPRSAWQTVGGDYFRTLQIPLVAGRLFTDGDDEHAPRVAIVNEPLARMLWPGQDPLGKRFVAGNATRREPVTIVGVVAGVRHDSLSAEPGPELYIPASQTVLGATFVVIRTTVDPRTISSAVRNTVWSVSRQVPISQMRTIDEVLSASTMRRRVILSLLTAFATVGLLLGVIGIYGLVAYSVRQRRREIGIRMALGATARDVSHLISMGGLQWAACGVAIGVVLALLLTRFMQGLIYGITPRDPVTLAVVPVLLLAVSWCAAYLPARRAAAVSPATVLQE
jgi:putative ABC transport system permease protein